MLSRDVIIRFVEDHFNESDYKIRGNEILLNSPFKQDKKYHLGISLSENKMGVWNDFKPPQDSGDFLKFVSLVLGLGGRNEAKKYLLEKYPSLFFESIVDGECGNVAVVGRERRKNDVKIRKIELPPYLREILGPDMKPVKYAKPYYEYLKGRGLTDEQIAGNRLMFGYAGRFEGFLVIPFFDDDGDPFYYVGRSIKGKSYINAPDSVAGGKSAGVAFNVFTSSEIVCITEGIFDAIAIGDAGVAVLGNIITDAQIEAIFMKGRKAVVWVGDNYKLDKAASDSLVKNVEKLAHKIKSDSPDTGLYVFDWSGPYSMCKDMIRCRGLDRDAEKIVAMSRKISCDDIGIWEAKLVAGLSAVF